MKDLASFDIPPGVRQADDPIVVLVNVHLHLEAFIIELASRRLAKPAALDFDRLNFPAKLGLAIALGAVPEIAGPALRTINTIRNRLAHNLRADVTEADGNTLRHQMSFIASDDNDDASLAPFRRVLLLALTLQAWLNGVVSAAESGLRLSPEAIKQMAEARYPMPPDPEPEAVL